MSGNFTIEQRTGPRYMIQIPVRAEWDDESSGAHIISEGETENVGPSGALVHLSRLPDVGSRVQLVILDAQGLTLEAAAEVLRLERNPAQPLAALQLLEASDEWRGLVWEPSAPHLVEARRSKDDDEDYY
ncbi:MAG TPA: PilZ domain-containing protein [Pyrinomonadaceae bacterium]|nr:PilZ domain-containing protein [Pyrinomonadaceae bacterium]